MYSRAEHRQHKHNKQASNNHLDRLMDDEVEGWLKVKVEECNAGVHETVIKRYYITVLYCE